jgi:hypothetical protein
VEKQSALTAAAWSPDRTVLVGNDEGAVFVVNPDDGSSIAPPGAVRSAVRAALAAESPQRAVPPTGISNAWAFAGAGAVSSFAFSEARTIVALFDSNRLGFYSPFVAQDAAETKNPKLHSDRPARLVKTVFVRGGTGIASVSFAPSYDESAATTTEGAVFVATGFLDVRKGMLSEEDGPSPFGIGMRTIQEGDGDAAEPAAQSSDDITAAVTPFGSRIMGLVSSTEATFSRAAADEAAAADEGAASDEAAASAASASDASNAPAISAAAEASKKDALRRIEHLRRRLEDVIARNDQADEITKVQRGELLMDETFKAQLVAEGETRVEELKARLEHENVIADYAASKIIKECWDTMETHGAAIVALNTPGLMVHKYPLKVEDRTARLGRRVAFLRRVELAEHAHFKDRKREGTRAADAKSAETSASDDLRVDANAVFDLRGDPPLGKSATGTGKPDPSENSKTIQDSASYEACLYDPSTLYPPRRKISQFSLLQMTARETKVAFNAEFAAMQTEKQKFVDKIHEINARVVDIRKELAGHAEDTAALFECASDAIEQETHVLSVQDSELKSARWLSREERAAAEAAAETERARARAKGENPPEDRALREMMGGRLEKAEELGVPDDLPKPEWMTEIDEKDWNDEQRKQGREFENKAKTYREELAKRRVVLAAELGRLHEESSETVMRFDDALAEFLVKKLAVDQRIAEMEADVVSLAHEVETALEDDEKEEARLADALERAESVREETKAALSAFELEIDQARKKRENCEAQNQKLDREFKRDFADADDLFDALYALYKRRKRAKHSGMKRISSGVSTGSGGGVSSGASSPARGATPSRGATTPGGSADYGASFPVEMRVPSTLSHVSEHDPFRGALGRPASEQTRVPKASPEPLDSYVDLPEGADDAWWFRLVEARDRKIVKEDELRVLDEQIQEMHRLRAKLLRADDDAREDAAAVLEAVSRLVSKRRDALYDVRLPVRVAQTYVETIEPEFELGGITDLRAQAAAKADAVLIDRSVVEYLNEVIRGHGAGKVETLIAIKDFKKGIYDLRWEKERLAMEAEDASHKIKEIQMARAPVGILREVLVDEREKPPPRKSGTVAGSSNPGNPKETEAAARRRRNELASLEARLEHAEASHARRVAEKQKELAKTQKKTSILAARNDAIAAQVGEMDAAVRDVAKLDDSRGGEVDNAREAKARKMRALVTQSKLQHIAKAQAEEIKSLREALERARLRTFPSFLERTPRRGDTVRLPDSNASREGRR